MCVSQTRQPKSGIMNVRRRPFVSLAIYLKARVSSAGRTGRGGAAVSSHVAQDKQRSLPGGSLSPRQEYDLGGVISSSIYYGQILARRSECWGGGVVRPHLLLGNLGSI